MRPTKAIDESGPKMKDPAILKCLPFKTFKSAPHFDNLWSCGGMHISKDILGNDGAGECIFHHGCVSVSSFQKWEMMFPPWMVSFFPRMFSKMVGAVDVLGLFKLHWTIENREPAGDRILYFIHCIMICLGWNNCCQTNPKEHIVDHKWSYDEIIQINCTVTVKIVKNDQTYLFFLLLSSTISPLRYCISHGLPWYLGISWLQKNTGHWSMMIHGYLAYTSSEGRIGAGARQNRGSRLVEGSILGGVGKPMVEMGATTLRNPQNGKPIKKSVDWNIYGWNPELFQLKNGGSWKLRPILRRMGYLRKQPAKLQKSTLSSKAIIGCLVIYWVQINLHNGFMFQPIDHP